MTSREARRSGRLTPVLVALACGGCATLGGMRGEGQALGTEDRESVCRLPVEEGELKLVLGGIDWQGWQRKCDDLMRYLRPGPLPFDGPKAVTIERLLEETGYFSTAICEHREAGLLLECRLVPQPMIKEIAFRGRLPVGMLREDLERRLFVAPGALLENEEKSLSEMRERLILFLEREGYFESEISITTAPIEGAEPNLALRMEVTIEAGRRARVRDIEVRGDELTEAEVESRIRRFGFVRFFPRRFRPDRFFDGLDELTLLLQERGFPEARVIGSWDLDAEEDFVDVSVEVDPGPRLELFFEGNHHLSDRRLSALASFAEAGIIDPTEALRSAAAIRDAYQHAGFPDVTVTSRSDQPDPRIIQVIFIIEEGQEAKIRRVELAGNEAVSDRKIQREAQLRTTRSRWFSAGRWTETQVLEDERAIAALYRERGFGAARIHAERLELPDGRIDVLFRIDERGKRHVRSLTIAGLPEDIDDVALMRRIEMQVAEPFIEDVTDRDQGEILAALAGAGYPMARVATIVDAPPAPAGGPVDIEHLVDPGPRSVIGGFFVRGNFRTRRSLIEGQLHLSPGDGLDLITLGESRRRLRGLGAFTSVEMRPLGIWRDPEETWQMIAVQERSARSLDLVASFVTDEGFSIGGDYRDRNLLGRAIHLDLRLRLGDLFGRLHRSLRIGRSDRLDMSLQAPGPFGAPFDADASVFYRYDDFPAFLDERLGVGAGLSRRILERESCRLCPDAIVQLRYEVSASRFELREEEDPDDPDEPEEPRAILGGPLANVGRIAPTISFDRRDSFVDPRRGWSADLRLELAHPLLSPLPEGYGFYRVLIWGRGYLHLGTPWERAIGGERVLGGPVVLAASAGAGTARPLPRGPGLPLSEALYYGGDYSVRGLSSFASAVAFPGANHRLTGSVEIRWYAARNLLMGSFQLAAFADAGAVSYAFADLLEEPAVSVGPVIRYLTPVGPLSLAWGVAIVRPPSIREARPDVIPERGRFHLTFGYSF